MKIPKKITLNNKCYSLFSRSVKFITLISLIIITLASYNHSPRSIAADNDPRTLCFAEDSFPKHRLELYKAAIRIIKKAGFPIDEDSVFWPNADTLKSDELHIATNFDRLKKEDAENVYLLGKLVLSVLDRDLLRFHPEIKAFRLYVLGKNGEQFTLRYRPFSQGRFYYKVDELPAKGEQIVYYGPRNSL